MPLYNILYFTTYIGLLYHQLEIGIRLAHSSPNELQVIGSFATRLLRIATGNVEGALAIPQTRTIRVPSYSVLQTSHPLLTFVAVPRLQVVVD